MPPERGSHSGVKSEHTGPVDGDCQPVVLWIDDQADDITQRLLALEGIRLERALSGSAGLEMAFQHPYDAHIVDLNLPDVYGLTVLERLRAHAPNAPVAILTGVYGEPESASLALKLGASDFWTKPLAADALAASVRRLLPAIRQSVAVVSPPPTPIVRYGIVAASSTMRGVIEWIDRVGPSDIPVLLTGETGTGKELVARALHACSGRRAASFVPVNCGAVVDGLRESELFGHCRGAFTGAIRDRQGLIEQASGGTLFLDEIADVSPAVQVELLRVLEGGEFRRVGDVKLRRADVRLVAATNRPLPELLARREFREDLYYRIAGTTCILPPLRERPADIDALLAVWLPAMRGSEKSEEIKLTDEAASLLRAQEWPGNVRQLRNVVECASRLSRGNQMAADDIREALRAGSPAVSATAIDSPGESEAASTLQVLERTQWNRTAAARLLGIDRKTLWRRLRKLRSRGNGD